VNRHEKRRHFELDDAHTVSRRNVPGDIADQNQVRVRPELKTELKPDVSKGDGINLGDWVFCSLLLHKSETAFTNLGILPLRRAFLTSFRPPTQHRP
jgi:hypothetical protein